MVESCYCPFDWLISIVLDWFMPISQSYWWRHKEKKSIIKNFQNWFWKKILYGKFSILSRTMPWNSRRFLGLYVFYQIKYCSKKKIALKILVVVLKRHMHLHFNKECSSSLEVLSDLNLKLLQWFWLVFSLGSAHILECVYRSWPQMLLLTQKLENIVLEGLTVSARCCCKLGPGLMC